MHRTAPTNQPTYWRLTAGDGTTLVIYGTDADASRRYLIRHRREIKASTVPTRYFMQHGAYPHVDMRRLEEAK